MLVVDLMHEFKLGVWKTLFIHLIRILYSAAPGGVEVGRLDERYATGSIMCCDLKAHQYRFHIIPQFNQTIQRFSNNVSKMKKLAVQDYEDLLQVSIFPDVLLPILTVPQCSIPAFEELLAKPHNKCLLKLLY
jgi:hypothetical protein